MLIRYFAAAAQAAGTTEEFLDPHDLSPAGAEGSLTLGGVLEHLSAREPVAAVAAGTAAPASATTVLPRRTASLAAVLGRCSFLVNGTSEQDPARLLGPDDELDVLPPFAGG